MFSKADIDKELLHCRTLHANGKYEVGKALALQCINQSLAIGDDELRFRSLCALSKFLSASEQYEEALNVLASALSLAETELEYKHIAKAWNEIGVLFMGGCVWELALDCFAKITESEELCNTSDAYHAYSNMALCHMYAGNVEDGLSAIKQAQKMQPKQLMLDEPYTFMFLCNTYTQIALQSNQISKKEIESIINEALKCEAINASNRSVTLLAKMINGSFYSAYGETNEQKEAGLSLLYKALDDSEFVPELMTDVLACLVQAEFLCGQHEKVRKHLQTWIQKIYQDAGCQASQKLGVANIWKTHGVLEDQWPELGLGSKRLQQSIRNGPPLPPGIKERFSEWIDSEAD